MSGTTHAQEVRISAKRTLRKGTEVSLRGKRGRYWFQYVRNVDRETGETVTELTFYGGPSGREQFTTVYPERVKVVHRKTRGASPIARALGKSGK